MLETANAVHPCNWLAIEHEHQYEHEPECEHERDTLNQHVDLELPWRV